jgi:5S rRNA maturation endonuclease (ribonuclease M5)
LEPDGDPKYDSEAGQRTALYNVGDLHRSEPWVAICEGELDALVMSGIVGVPAVGIPGVEHWLKKNGGGSIWGRLFQDYQTVYVVMDPDKAGKKVVQEIARRVENPMVIDLPADVNDTVQEHGPEWVLDKMGLD